MDMIAWALIAGGALVLAGAALWFAPARTTILIDTTASAARAEMRSLWGLGPAFFATALPKGEAGNPYAPFTDAVRVGNALMTPGIANVAYAALLQLIQLRPRMARFELGMNLNDSAQNLVVHTAVQAALAAAPASMREVVAISKCEAPGAELVARFELNASPMQLSSIYNRLKTSGPAREFRRRLKRKPKAIKKNPREVRTS